MLTLPATWFSFAVWQSTLFLGAALALDFLVRKTPWKVHALLVLGVLAAVFVPVFSSVIALQNGGMLAGVPFMSSFASFAAFFANTAFGGILLGGSVLVAACLLYGILASRRLMFRAKPFPDRESQEALLASAKILRHVSLPIVFTSDDVKSPTVWSWGLHPAVLLPESLAQTLTPTERNAIFLHELAHIARRDHWSAFLLRCCGAALFWNPLYWIAVRRADHRADESCDLLVVAHGTVAPEVYAETLLRLAAAAPARSGRYFSTLQFSSHKETLMKRIDTVFDFADARAPVSVAQQPLWIATVFSAVLLFGVALAFCQEKKDAASMPQISAPNPRLAEIEKTEWFGKLNEQQRLYVRWDENQFAYAYDPKNYEVGETREAFEERWIAELEKPEPGYPGHTTLSRYDEAILGLATIQSDRALKPLLKIATERVLKDNAHRHFATKALGILGDRSAIPGLIPLLYHFNFNTRWDAQITLVRLTGQNFGDDAAAWGKWFAENRESLGKDLPEFNVEHVDWSCGDEDVMTRLFCDPEVQKKSDAQFFRMQKMHKKTEEATPQETGKSPSSPQFTISAVGKTVDAFPDKHDLSTPEAAYATYERMMCRRDLEDYMGAFLKLSVPTIKISEAEKKRFAPPDEEWARVLLDAKILETYIDGINACVVAKLEGENVRKPYNLRWFEKHEGEWLNAGNDRVDSIVEARAAFARAMKRRAFLKNSTEGTRTSFKDLLGDDGLDTYRVDKKIADFPEEVDLSSPEAAYASQKRLLASDRKDKIDALESMQYFKTTLSERERKELEPEPDAESAKTYRDEFVVLEVVKRNEDRAIVFGLRKFDGLFDANLFRRKDDGKWYNLGNFQDFDPVKLAAQVDSALGR